MEMSLYVKTNILVYIYFFVFSVFCTAFLRRGVAYKGKKEYVKAKKDLQQALSLESTNKRAKV